MPPSYKTIWEVIYGRFQEKSLLGGGNPLKTENLYILSIKTDIVRIITHKLVYKEVRNGQNRQQMP